MDSGSGKVPSVLDGIITCMPMSSECASISGFATRIESMLNPKRSAIPDRVSPSAIIYIRGVGEGAGIGEFG
jgi:hypothetical protein